MTAKLVIGDSIGKYKIIKDLGMQLPRPDSKKKRHYVLAECPGCNNEWRVRPDKLKTHDSATCWDCMVASKDIRNKAPSCVGNIKIIADHGMCFCKSKDKKKRRFVTARCLNCGHEWKTRLDRIKTNRLGFCNKCRGSIQISNGSEVNGIKVVRNLGAVYLTKSSKKKLHCVILECEYCGNQHRVIRSVFLNGKSRRCKNCLRITHGIADSRLHIIWMGMRQRCNDKNSTSYNYYGGRGITVCKKWEDAEVFIKWALENGYSDDLSIDRINNDKGYYPENCRFTTNNVQARNTRLLMSTNTSGYRGVSQRRSNGKWLAQVGRRNKVIRLGDHDTAEQAAYVRDKYIIDHGLEHTLNFPDLRN